MAVLQNYCNRGKKQNIRSCCGWSKVHCLLGDTQCAVLRVKTVYLVDTHPGSWINIKSSVILMRLLNHAGLSQTVQHPSRHAVKLGKFKKKDAQEIYRIINFFGVNQKIAEICMLPPVAELRITLSYITQQTVISTSINLHQIIIIIMIIMSLQDLWANADDVTKEAQKA